MLTVTIDQLAPSTLAFAATPTKRPNNKNQYVETTLNTGKAPPNVQLSTDKAPLCLPFGLSAPYGDEAGGQRHTLDVSASIELAAWASAIDEALVQHAVKHSQAWFGEALDEATVRAMHHPLMRSSDKYEPSLRLKANPKTVKLWRAADRAPIDVDELTASAAVVPVVALGNVWFLDDGRMFGLSLGMKLGLVSPSLGLDDFVFS